MSARIFPMTVSLTVPLAEAPAAPALLAEGIPAEITRAGDGYVILRVSYDGNGVSWVPVDDETTVSVRIDTDDSQLVISAETDAPAIPPAIYAVNEAVQNLFQYVPADESPVYMFQLSVSYDQIVAAIDDDHIRPLSIDKVYTIFRLSALLKMDEGAEVC